MCGLIFISAHASPYKHKQLVPGIGSFFFIAKAVGSIVWGMMKRNGVEAPRGLCTAWGIAQRQVPSLTIQIGVTVALPRRVRVRAKESESEKALWPCREREREREKARAYRGLADAGKLDDVAGAPDGQVDLASALPSHQPSASDRPTSGWWSHSSPALILSRSVNWEWQNTKRASQARNVQST